MTGKFLFWTFALSWAIQVGVGILYKFNLTIIGKFLIALIMYVPLIGVLLSGNTLKGMGWRPKFKNNIKSILIAWFLPSVLIIIGAALYFIIFPSHFDLSGEYLKENVGPEALEQLEKQGISYKMYVLINLISSIIYVPFINMFFAVGEEAGWRGYLYPKLKEKFGKIKGWLIGGIIWGIWHWPLIWLIGYEYGTDYVGFPVVGMLIFCIFTTSCGIFCDWLYEKTQCIWVPSILHGAINGTATVTLAVCITNTGSYLLLGPAPMGLISVLPIVVLSIYIVIDYCKNGRKEEKNSILPN